MKSFTADKKNRESDFGNVGDMAQQMADDPGADGKKKNPVFSIGIGSDELWECFVGIGINSYVAICGRPGLATGEGF